MGSKEEKIDNALFLKSQGKELLIIQIYVDDIIFGATSGSLCEEFVPLMRSEFEMSNGRIEILLDLQIKQTPNGISFCQREVHQGASNEFSHDGSQIHRYSLGYKLKAGYRRT